MFGTPKFINFQDFGYHMAKNTNRELKFSGMTVLEANCQINTHQYKS